MADNIFPIYDRLILQSDREKRWDQKAKVLWMTGLSGAGKSTLAMGLERRLWNEGKNCIVLDGDNLRSGLCRDLGFTEEQRNENIRRVAEVAKLLLRNGVIVICSFVSPLEAQRSMVKEIVGSEDFVEIFVHAELELCKLRDVKGLYEKARLGLIANFTGIQAGYEVPKNPDIVIDTSREGVNASVGILYDQLKSRIEL